MRVTNLGPAVLVPMAVGVGASVAGSYVYSYLATAHVSAGLTIGSGVVLGAVAVALYVLRGKWFLIGASGIKGYYPKGQGQCLARIVDEIEKSKSLVIVGARGMDLVGERSPFAEAILRSRNLDKIEVLLLTPGGKNARLRSEYLEVERQKYVAECESVDRYLGVLSVHEGRPILKYSYSEKPQFRIIATDRSIFVSLYRSGQRGRDLPVWNLSRGSLLANSLDRFIDTLRLGAELRTYSADHGVTQ